MNKQYRLYVEMTRYGFGTGVYRLISGPKPLTHEDFEKMAKNVQPPQCLLVEADSPEERSLVLYEGWHDDLDARIAELRDKRSKCQG